MVSCYRIIRSFTGECTFMKKLLLILLMLLAFVLPVSALADAPAVLAGVELVPGYYLANDEDVLTAYKPAIGGYA